MQATQTTEAPVPGTEQLAAALEAHGERLTNELRQLSEMPQVRMLPSSLFDRAKPPGSKAQQRGIVVKLSCCKEPIDQKCNNFREVRDRAFRGSQ